MSSSIPSKHSVVIKPVIRSKGFGNSAERFESQDAVERTEIPGPGRYNPPMVNPWGQSVGGKLQPKKKGKPGIVPMPFLNTHSGNIVKGGPGPGAYNISSIFEEHSLSKGPVKRKPSTFGMSARSSSLHSLHKSEIDSKRGPGEYNITSPHLNSNPGVSMKSTSKRLMMPNSETNHLDFYDVGKNMLMKKNYVEPEFSSAFAKPYKAMLRKVRLHELDKIRKVIDIKPGSKAAPNIWQDITSPGPGQYDYQKSYLFLQEYNLAKDQSPLLFPGFRSKNPRIPYPKEEKKPDPATYNLPSTFDTEKFQVKSPMFMSESLRDATVHHEVYESAMPYDPTMKPRQRSFHKNPKGCQAVWH